MVPIADAGPSVHPDARLDAEELLGAALVLAAVVGAALVGRIEVDLGGHHGGSLALEATGPRNTGRHDADTLQQDFRHRVQAGVGVDDQRLLAGLARRADGLHQPSGALSSSWRGTA